MTTKYESFEKFEEFKSMVENKKDKKIKIIRSDIGGECFLDSFCLFC